MRYALTDAEWRVIEPVLPCKPRGIPRVDDRRVIDGVPGESGRGECQKQQPRACRTDWLIVSEFSAAHTRASRHPSGGLRNPRQLRFLTVDNGASVPLIIQSRNSRDLTELETANHAFMGDPGAELAVVTQWRLCGQSHPSRWRVKRPLCSASETSPHSRP